MDTIEKKINALGLAKRRVQQRGGGANEARAAGAAAGRGRSGAREADSEDGGDSGVV